MGSIMYLNDLGGGASALGLTAPRENGDPLIS